MEIKLINIMCPRIACLIQYLILRTAMTCYKIIFINMDKLKEYIIIALVNACI